MKKFVRLWAFLSLLASSLVFGQTFPVPNLQVNGTSTFAGTLSGAGITALLGPYAPLASPNLTGTPTTVGPAQFDSSTKIANTGFVQRALGNAQSALILGSATSLTASQVGEVFSSNGYPVTLPAWSSVPSGGVIRVINGGSATLSVLPNGSDTIWTPTNGSASSVSLIKGSSALFIATGAQWQLFDGTALLQFIYPQGLTAAQFDNTTTLATDAFVQRALGNRQQMGGTSSTTYSLSLSQLGQTIQFFGSSAGTWTIPSIATMPTGSEYEIINGSSSTLTIQVNGGSDKFVNSTGSGITSFVMQSGDSVRLVSNGNQFVYITGGSVTYQWGGGNIVTTGINVKGTYSNSGKLVLSNIAPTISSGFGTGAAIQNSNGSIVFQINVGTGGTATSGVIGLPTASNGWNCRANDITTTSSTVFMTKQTAYTTSSATIANYNTSGAQAAWAASDILNIACAAF